MIYLIMMNLKVLKCLARLKIDSEECVVCSINLLFKVEGSDLDVLLFLSYQINYSPNWGACTKEEINQTKEG